MDKAYNILLYYCYTPIDDPEAFREEHHLYCIENNLRGRIILAKEGINGTISGLREDCEKYMYDLKADARFSHIHFKVETHHAHVFQKLHVRVKAEVVHANLPHINPAQKAGKYIAPADFKKMKDEEDVVLLDVRSNYEHSIGKFKNAITLDIDNFRDFPQKIDVLAPYQNKKIITYCTGGIKCEKASAYLLEKGFKNVYQLHGGIIQYGLMTDGEDFEGKCYIFDNRLTTTINKRNPVVVGKCHVCHTPCDRMVNCANPNCNIHVPICEACAKELDGACSEACQKHPARRAYDGTGYYTKKMYGYNPYKFLYVRPLMGN
ncbi:MAG: rhodanese-related sulfurtransferase [Cytophagales bacterium]|nr:rhodanese-related sulfurtransferase [Cytophagales bacterium]